MPSLTQHRLTDTTGNNIMGTLIFYIFFGVCFICSMIRTSYHVLENRGSRLAESKKSYRLLLIAMFFLFFSWFGMLFNDPYEMNLPSWVRYTGLALFIIGVSFFVISHLRIRGLDSDRLIMSGIYSKIRHPMYLGFILWVIGLPVFMNALFTLASAAIWIPHILYWRVSEERQLEKRYENYQEYKKKTWF